MASNPAKTETTINTIFQRAGFMVVPQAQRAIAGRVLRPASDESYD
jgi:hypothetical protein